jgi:excisionase family DNA binding protein
MSNVMLLTIEAAATRGGVSGGTIRKLIRRGLLPGVRFSHRNLRVPADALDRFIEARVVEAEATRVALAAARKRVS